MSYFGTFKRFDPILGYVPAHPFSFLPQIAQRARSLLRDRTTEQLDSAGEAISFALFAHFDELKQDEIAKLLRQAIETGDYERYFEWDGGTAANGRWLFKEGMEDELDIPTAYNTSEVDALKANEGFWEEIGSASFPNCQPYELFAVLSLWMLAEAVISIQRKDDPFGGLDKAFQPLLESLGSTELYVPFAISSIAEGALKAMDAVCYAEYLQVVGWWEATHTRTREQQEQEHRLRSVRAEALIVDRHRKNNEAKQTVTKEWDKNRSKWPSAEEAGACLATWLTMQGFRQYKTRTVAGWIRVHAKEIGVRLR